MASCGLLKRPTILLLAAVCFVAQFSASTSVPFSAIERSEIDAQNVCAQTCNQLNGLVHYKTGNTYSYQVKMNTQIDSSLYDITEQQQQEVQITAFADVSVHAPCELVLRLRNVEMSGVAKSELLAKQLEQEPLHFAYDDGQVMDVCSSLNEHTWALNVKKSIISALQMSTSDLSQTRTIVENDINGQCETTYEPIENYRNTITIRKNKELTKCGQRHQFHIGFFPRSYGLDQVLRSALPLANTTYECIQKVSNEIVTETKCEEEQKMWPLNMKIRSQIACKFAGMEESLRVDQLRAPFRKHLLTMSHEYQYMNNEIGQKRHYTVKDVEHLLKQLCANVQESVQLVAPQLFGELIRAKQSPLSVSEEEQLYESVRSGQYCQSTKLVDLFLDASALAGTEGSTEVLLRAYQQKQVSSSRASYLFTLLTFAKSPTVEAAKRLVTYLKQTEHVPRGVVFGVTGFVRNLRLYDSHHHYQQIDTLVQELHQVLVERVERYVRQPELTTECLTYVFALKNVGVYSSNQKPIVQRLLQVIHDQKTVAYTNEVRVAIVRALVDGADDQTRQYLLQSVLQDEQQTVELRVEAYKTILFSGTTRQQLESIKNYLKQIENSEHGEQLANYVRSHQENLRKTSDVHKQTVLPLDAPVFEPPKSQPVGITRNYELSYLSQGLGLGFTVEADALYEQTHKKHGGRSIVPVPESVSFNFTVPVLGKEVQVVEVHFHQHGLEPLVMQQLQRLSRNTKMDVLKVLKEIFDLLIENGSEMFTKNPDVKVLIQVAYDGKTVVLVDEHDFAEGDMFQQGILSEIMEKLQGRVLTDRAFGVTPVDFVGQVSSINGLPVQVRLNSSVVFGLKSEFNVDARDISNSVLQFVVLPSVASQTEFSVEFFTGTERKSVEHVTRFYSAPHVNLLAELKQGRIMHVKFNMPQSKYVLARIESEVFTRNVNGERVRNTISKRDSLDKTYHLCTESTRKPFGVEFCYDVTYNNDFHKDYSFFAAEVSIVRVDPRLTSYEIYAEMPYSLEQIFSSKNSLRNLEPALKAPFKFVFNTPGSSVDREIIFELELPQKQDETQKEVRLHIKSPFKQIFAQAYIRNMVKEQVINMELTVDNKKYFQMELGLEKLRRGPKIEYKPRLILSMGNRFEPVHMTGVISYAEGKKSVLFVALNDLQKEKQYFKGTLIKVGKLSDSAFRASAECSVDIFDFTGKLGSTLERSERVLKLDINSEYQHPLVGGRQTAKVAFKFQNLSSGKMVKIVNYGAIQLSQFPKYTVQYDHHIMYGSSEYFEHDLKLGWNNDPEQVRAYQMVKVVGQRGKYDIESNTVVVYKPEHINYEIKGTSALVGFGINGQKRYNMILNGKSRDGSTEANDFRAELSYSHLSKSPLKMKMRASVKSASIDFIYSDEIEEKNPNTYHGQLLIQLNPVQKYTANYVYEMKKKNGNEYQHEIEVELNNQNTRKMHKHRSMLRMIPSEQLLVQSKLSSDDGDIFDGELNWNRNGASRCQFNYGSDTSAKFNIDPHARPAKCQLELRKQNWKHDSSIEYLPTEHFELNSRTKRDNDDIFSLQSRYEPNQLTQVKVSSIPFEGQLDYNIKDRKAQKALFEFQMPNSWKHSSNLQMMPDEERFDLKSSTHHQNHELVDLVAKYHSAREHFLKMSTPIMRTDMSAKVDEHGHPLKSVSLNLESAWLNHQSKLNVEPEYVKFNTRTLNNGKTLADLRYDWQNNVHNIELDSDDFIKAKAECNMDHQKPFANVDITMKNKDGETIEHQTNLFGERDSQNFNLDSRTLKENQNVAQIKATIKNDGSKKSFINMRIGDHAISNIEVAPYKSAKIEVNCPHYDHVSEFNYEPKEEYYGSRKNWRLHSSTTDKHNSAKYLIHCQHEGLKQTGFQLDIPQFDTKFHYQHPEEDLSNHHVTFDLNTKTVRPELRHHTDMKYVQNGHRTPYVQLKSRTTRHTGENILEMNGAYRHLDTETPSNFDVKIGKSIYANIITNPFHSESKTLKLTGVMGDGQNVHLYNHDTSVEYRPLESSLKVESETTKSGSRIARLDSFLTTDSDKKSYFHLKGHDNYHGLFEIEPRQKRGLLDFNFAPYEHKTEFYSDLHDKVNGGYKLSTTTKRDHRDLLSLDTALNRPTAESYLKFHACPTGCYKTEMNVHPERRSGKLSIESDVLKHNTLFGVDEEPRYSGKKVYLKSQTSYQDELIADLDAKMRGINGANELECNIPKFSLKSLIDIPNREGKFDFRHHHTGRHLLGSVYLNQNAEMERSFHVDFAWDVDRNPNSKLVIEVNGKRLSPREENSLSGKSGEILLVVQAEYAQNKLIVKQQFTPKRVFFNPILCSVAFIAPNDNDSWEVTYSHQKINDSRYECKLHFRNEQQIKYGLELNSEYSEDKFDFTTNVISATDVRLQNTWKVSGVRRAPGKYHMDAKAVHAYTEVYELILDVDHSEQNRIDGKVELKMPNKETQFTTFYLDFVQQQVLLEINNEKLEKMLVLQGSISDELVELTTVARFSFYPEIIGTFRYVPRKELLARVDVNKERKLEYIVKYTGSFTEPEFKLLSRFQCLLTPTIEFTCEGVTEQQDYYILASGKFDAEEVLYGKFKRSQSDDGLQGWTVEGWINRSNGVRLAQALLKSAYSAELLRYDVEFEPNQNELTILEPLYVSANGRYQENGLKVISIKVTRGQTQDWINVDLTLKTRNQEFRQYFIESLPVPEKLETVIVYAPTQSRLAFRLSFYEPLEVDQERERNLFEIEPLVGQRVTDKVRHQLVMSLNEQNVGFELVTSTFDRKYSEEHNLKVYIPANDRVIQYRCAHHLSPERFYMRSQFKSDIRQRQPVYQYLAHVYNGRHEGRPSYIGRIEVDSVKFERTPKQIEFVAQIPTEYKPLDVVAVIDIGRKQSDALKLEAVYEQRQSNYGSQLNTTFHWLLQSKDSVLDIGVDAHVSDSSIGLVWHNVNRFGNYQQGWYQFHMHPNNRFEAELAHPTFQYFVNGQYKTKSSTKDLVLDCIVNKFTKRPRSQQMVLEKEHKVHVETQGKCLRADIEDTQNTDTYRQVNICLDADRANIINVAVDTIRNGEKTTDLKIRLDTQSVTNTLKLYLRWNPKYGQKLLSIILSVVRQEQWLTSSELVQEVCHKYLLLLEKLYDSQYQKFIVEELIQIIDELNINLEQWYELCQYYLITPFEQYNEVVCNLVKQLTQNGFRCLREICECIQQFCYRFKPLKWFCELFTSIDSVEQLRQIVAERLVEALQRTHRFVATSRSGRYIRQLIPNISIPEPIEKLTCKVYEMFSKVLLDNTAFRQLWRHCERIINELYQSSELNTINWDRVNQSIQEALNVLFNPVGLKSTGRVLVWDPQQGELQLEIYNTVAQHRRLFHDRRQLQIQGNKTDFMSRFYGSDDRIRDVVQKRRQRSMDSIELAEVDSEEILSNNRTMIQLSSIWVEEMLSNDKVNNITDSSQPLILLLTNHHIPSLQRRISKVLHLYSMEIDNQTVASVQQYFHQKSMLLVQVDQFKMSINENLQWELYISSFGPNDSIVVVGQTINVKIVFNLNPRFNVDAVYEMHLTWTPLRKLISIETNLVMNKTETVTKPVVVKVALMNRKRSNRNQTLFFNRVSILKLLDELFQEGYTGFDNNTVLIEGKNPRESICFRWMRFKTIKYTDLEWSLCNSVTEACNMAAYFVLTKQLYRVPNQCLVCETSSTTQQGSLIPKRISKKENIEQDVRLGFRTNFTVSNQAEVILMLDGSCLFQNNLKSLKFMTQLFRLTKAIGKKFRSQNIQTKFLLITAEDDGIYRIKWPKFERSFDYTYMLTAQSRQMSRRTKIIRNSTVVEGPIFMESIWNRNGKHSLDFLHLFPYAPGLTSRHFIMVDCLGTGNSSTCSVNEVDFNTARNNLLHSNTFFHVITGMRLSPKPTNKQRHAMGIDWKKVFFDNGAFANVSTKNTLPVNITEISCLLREQILPQRDICHVLALETNGTVFNHKVFKKINRIEFASRLVSNHQQNQCQQCDCMLSRDRLSVQEECTLCEPRPHTLSNPYKRSDVKKPCNSNETVEVKPTHDWHLGVEQIWTEEDEDIVLDVNHEG